MQHRESRHGLVNWLVFLGVAAALAALVWTGWSLLNHRNPIPAFQNTVVSRSSVTVGLTDAPDTLDIRTADSTALDRALIGNVYETLLGVDENNSPSPGVASAWTVSEDGLTLDFTLRKGLTFSNGHTLDSSDVVQSIQQAVEGQWPDAAAKFAHLASVTNPDANTVRIELSEPDATLPYTLAGRLGIVYDAEADIDYATEAVGSGPFTVARFKQDKWTEIRLAAREDGEAKTESVILHYYPDDSSLLKAAEYGNVDLIVPEDPANADGLADAPSYTVTHGVSTRKTVLVYNNDADSILSDQRARQAMRLMLDKQSLTEGRADVTQTLGGPIGPLEPGYEDLTSVLPYDRTAGQSMLSYFSASYIGTIVLIAPQNMQTLAQSIADQYGQAGLDVRLDTLDDATFAQRLADRDFQLALTETDGADGTAAYADPQSDAHYTNADAQTQYRNAVRATGDDAYRQGLMTYARTISEDAASDWLYVERTAVAASNGITGVPGNMTDTRLPLTNIARP